MGALLARGDEALWAAALSDEERARTPRHLHCPVERVVRAAHILVPGQAEWLLRARIYGLGELTASGWGLIKVAAKRYTPLGVEELERARARLLEAGVKIRDVPLPPPAQVERLNLPPFECEQAAGRWLLYMTHKENDRLRSLGAGQESPLSLVPCELNEHQHEHQYEHQDQRRWRGARRVVGALLLDHELKPWGMSFKQTERHPLYHAEWALLDAFIRSHSELSHPLTLLSTLKPCKLCAGAWVTHNQQRLRVLYLSDDPGKMGQHTAFDEGSFAWENAGVDTTQVVQRPLILMGERPVINRSWQPTKS